MFLQYYFYFDIKHNQLINNQEANRFYLQYHTTSAKMMIAHLFRCTTLLVTSLLLLLLPASTLSALSLEKAKELTIDLQSCMATLTSNVTSVNCTFLTPTNFTVQAELSDIACADFTYPASGGVVTDTGINDTLSVTTTFSEDSITLFEKNNLTQAIRTYCARCDIFHVLTDEPDAEEISVIAKKVNLTVTFNYTKEAFFTIDNIQTEVYEAEVASSSATRQVSLNAYQCNSDVILDQYPVNVGTVMNLCIETGDDEAADVTIADIEYLGFEGETGTVVEPILDGETNFITEYNCTLNGGRMCHVKTLMVPNIFDEYGDQPMKVVGIVGVEFVEIDADARNLRGDEGETNNFVPLKEHDGREMLAKSQDRVPFAVIFQMGASTTALKVQTDLYDEANKNKNGASTLYYGFSLTVMIAVLTSWMVRSRG